MFLTSALGTLVMIFDVKCWTQTN